MELLLFGNASRDRGKSNQRVCKNMSINMSINMDKVRKYTWILLCTAIIIYRISLLIAMGSANDLRIIMTVSNIIYILMFTTAILHELKVSKKLLYVMVALCLLTFIYGAFFTKLWV